jgi:hypothetical protein
LISGLVCEFPIGDDGVFDAVAEVRRGAAVM